MTIATENLFREPFINSKLQKMGDEKYYGSGSSFRPDVICDLGGKLRNWRKGLRFEISIHFSDSGKLNKKISNRVVFQKANNGFF